MNANYPCPHRGGLLSYLCTVPHLNENHIFSKRNVERNTNLKKVFNPGDVLPVIIEKINTEEKRISLSTVVSNEEQDNAYEYMSSHKDDDDGETYNPFAALLKK